MKKLFALVFALGLALAASAQTQPGVYGTEFVSGTTHVELWLINPAQLATIQGIVGIPPANLQHQTIEVSLRSDNPQTETFNVTLAYQLSTGTFIQSLQVPNAPTKTTEWSVGGISIPEGTVTLLSLTVTELPQPAAFQLQRN
jgi:hypothetical protein